MTDSSAKDLHGDLVRKMGIEYVEVSAKRLVATMPVAGNTMPYGLLHGGATCVLAETVGSFASALYAGEGATIVGLEISVTHHRPVRDGHVTATARPLRLGRTVACYDVRVVDDAGLLVATARMTCMLRAGG